MNFPQISPAVFILLFAWSIIWKGIALWKSARQDQRNWFITILVINTAGILELIFLFYFSKKRLTMSGIKKFFSEITLK
jgi:methionyl-tRNA synthetase